MVPVSILDLIPVSLGETPREALRKSLEIYRHQFKPSKQLAQPYAMLGVNVVAADSDEAARRQFTTVQQSFTNLVRGAPGKLQARIDDIDEYWNPGEKHHASRMLKYSIVGSPETVQRGLEDFVELTATDELMIVTSLYDHGARLRSYELVAELVLRG